MCLLLCMNPVTGISDAVKKRAISNILKLCEFFFICNFRKYLDIQKAAGQNEGLDCEPGEPGWR